MLWVGGKDQVIDMQSCIKYADSFMQRFAGPLANYNESVIGFISVVVQHK